MRIILASLALLPVIASHMYQLPPLSPSTRQQYYPMGLLQNTRQQNPKPSQDDPEVNEVESEPNLGYLAFSPLSREAKASADRGSQASYLVDAILPLAESQGFPRQSQVDSWGGFDSPNAWRNYNMDANLHHLLHVLAVHHLQTMPGDRKASADQESLRLLDRSKGMKKSEASSSASLDYPLLVSLGPFAQKLQRSSHNSPSKSSRPGGIPQGALLGPSVDGAKRTHSKRYLGIELPDYIASNYGVDRPGNNKLHTLKQRMRNVGK